MWEESYEIGRYGISERELRNYRWKKRRQIELRRRVIYLAVVFLLTVGIAISFRVIVSCAKAEEECYKYYTRIEVKQGTTLWSIAEEYKGDHYKKAQNYIDEVIRINHLSGDSIYAGQHLVIPYYSADIK